MEGDALRDPEAVGELGQRDLGEVTAVQVEADVQVGLLLDEPCHRVEHHIELVRGAQCARVDEPQHTVLHERA